MRASRRRSRSGRRTQIPAGTENRVEFFANLYSAFKPGNLCFELYDGPTATPSQFIIDCTGATGWNPTISNAFDLWQVFGTGESLGPNDGYVPFAYDPNTTYTLRWRFTYDAGANSTFKDVTFTTLAGPDHGQRRCAQQRHGSMPERDGHAPERLPARRPGQALRQELSPCDSRSAIASMRPRASARLVIA